MRRYETMVLLSDQLDDEQADELYTKIKSQFTDNGATIVEEAWWGKRRLAYPIDKRDYGWYGVLDIEAAPEAVAEVQRLMKINDDVVRFKTVRPEIRVHRNIA